MWHGYSDKTTEGKWQWVNPAGQCKTFTQWTANQPNGAQGENCATLRKDSGTWNDENCGTKKASICELGTKAKQMCPGKALRYYRNNRFLVTNESAFDYRTPLNIIEYPENSIRDQSMFRGIQDLG